MDAVIAAEFDIDKGSVCRVQYPRDVGDASLLAELMLPEGAHNHFQDWTVFVLNRPDASADKPNDGSSNGAASGDQQKHAAGSSVSDEHWPVHAYRYSEGGTDEPGWVLIDSPGGGDAGAAAHHEAFLELGGGTTPGLVLVVDLGGGEKIRLRHHDELQYSALQPDFASIYSIEGDAYGLHFRAAAQQEAFAAAVEKAAAAAAPPPPMLWCLNHVSNRRDATVRRGAQVKALAICSRFRWVHVWKPVLLLAVDRMYALSTGLGEYSESVEQQCRHLYDALNALSVAALPPVSDLQRQAHRLMLAQGSAQRELTHVGHVVWPPATSGKIPLRVPLMLQEQELADTSVGDLLRRFKHGLLCVFHALLDKQRIMFLGHSQPAETVCMSVLSCPLLVCPPLGHILKRCFPYTTLNNLDFLECEGFIAGTTNPIFESHPEWWDVLCDIDTGKVLVSAPGDKGRRVGVEPPRLSELDDDLFEQVSTGAEARYSEYWLRACFQEHAQHLVAERRRGSAALVPSPNQADGVPSVDMAALYLEQLKSGRNISDKEMLHILGQLFAFAGEEARLTQLLAMLPASSPTGCLSPIAAALFHSNANVRALASSLMRTVEAHKAAKDLVAGSNAFLLSGYTDYSDSRS